MGGLALSVIAIIIEVLNERPAQTRGRSWRMYWKPFVDFATPTAAEHTEAIMYGAKNVSELPATLWVIIESRSERKKPPHTELKITNLN